jgi:dipeptidyl-peptidase 4
VTPESDPGANEYTISPTGAFAVHRVSRRGVPPRREIVSLPTHSRIRELGADDELKATLAKLDLGSTSFVELKTADGQAMNASIILPPKFDPHKRYPLFFNVYGEPAGTTVNDSWDGRFFLV